MNVRSATAADIPALITLEKHAVTAAHWTRHQYDSIFGQDGPRRLALVIEEEGSIKGFLVACAIEREWEIENIAIAAAARRRGWGTRLVGELIDLARAQGADSVFLEVRESNRAARALYEKWAFVEAGCRPRYYHEPEEDAILYRMVFQ